MGKSEPTISREFYYSDGMWFVHENGIIGRFSVIRNAVAFRSTFTLNTNVY